MPKRKKVSYIRKSFARRSFFSLGLAIGALVLGIFGIAGSVLAAGEGQLNTAAAVFCSLVVSLFSLAYGFFSFLEKDKKYTLSKIGIGISGFLVLFWIVLIIIGMR